MLSLYVRKEMTEVIPRRTSLFIAFHRVHCKFLQKIKCLKPFLEAFYSVPLPYINHQPESLFNKTKMGCAPAFSRGYITFISISVVLAANTNIFYKKLHKALFILTPTTVNITPVLD